MSKISQSKRKKVQERDKYKCRYKYNNLIKHVETLEESDLELISLDEL